MHSPVRCSLRVNPVAQMLQEFAVFMWLLKSAKKGLPVPAAPLSSAQLRQFAGYSREASSGRLEYQVSPASPCNSARWLPAELCSVA